MNKSKLEATKKADKVQGKGLGEFMCATVNSPVSTEATASVGLTAMLFYTMCMMDICHVK